MGDVIPFSGEYHTEEEWELIQLVNIGVSKAARRALFETTGVEFFCQTATHTDNLEVCEVIDLTSTDD